MFTTTIHAHHKYAQSDVMKTTFSAQALNVPSKSGPQILA